MIVHHVNPRLELQRVLVVKRHAVCTMKKMPCEKVKAVFDSEVRLAQNDSWRTELLLIGRRQWRGNVRANVEQAGLNLVQVGRDAVRVCVAVLAREANLRIQLVNIAQRLKHGISLGPALTRVERGRALIARLGVYAEPRRSGRCGWRCGCGGGRGGRG